MLLTFSVPLSLLVVAVGQWCIKYAEFFTMYLTAWIKRGHYYPHKPHHLYDLEYIYCYTSWYSKWWYWTVFLIHDPPEGEISCLHPYRLTLTNGMMLSKHICGDRSLFKCLEVCHSHCQSGHCHGSCSDCKTCHYRLVAALALLRFGVLGRI